MTQALPFGFARRHGILLDDRAAGPTWLVREGADLQALSEACRMAGSGWPVRQVDDANFAERLAACYGNTQDAAETVVQGLGQSIDLERLAETLPQASDLLEQQDDAPIIRLLNALLSEAVQARASDIHLETFEQQLRVRMRIDGVMREVLSPPRALAALLVSRIKVMARLDIAERRVPQDGRISLRLAGHEVDVRVSTLPAAHGERVVLRLLDKQAVRLDIEHMAMQPAARAGFEHMLSRPHGIFLVTGPTGSGKTTTLYTALAQLNQTTRNILTVEDPIEYHLPGIGQTQVNGKVDMTFARGLRAILRQDPDVVMVGEIRDRETADVAVQASLTGHLVLSTLHTNSALGAITRLADMGIDTCLLASSLAGVMAQRLVRRLCPLCKLACPLNEVEAGVLGVAVDASACLYRAQGCEHCQQGYSGRLALHEMVVVTPKLAQAIHVRASEAQMLALIRQEAASLFEHGVQRVLQGETSVAELLRVAGQD
ncbi:type II secretion system ATPase GspE [Pseudomonas sichuanensis]|uniref:type II secretion system ATPase GspE n=1 Tax=Pseudomonas sichuanensis TaxID=2213015 RepID=UPI0024490ABF|nr:type II secretion system ATPase GspE [Pseudomonas sichuanensis]MDH0730835.1 type II secretion system ATPase GspE [Pseudomonas sichuanensis]MDH1582040.1 type II secretion system ATPase GspE [Pseudomonas sichuanensis]MDH1594559.1 type II secretion system ATPase GspE [Pseudomonas sichuanensis]MDH1596587.1 type II secretion system ATPase GspE [Pseudomonas sichuanensis]